MKIHHGHKIQIVWIPMIVIIQLFLFNNLNGLIITLVGTIITFLYSNYITNKIYANSIKEVQEKKK